jgi:two-component system, OmpR family, sensor histidine kinase KdpD
MQVELSHRSGEASHRFYLAFWNQLVQIGSARGGQWSLRGVLASLGLVGLLTIAGLWIDPIIKEPNLVMLYMLAVVFAALRWGWRAAVVTAISSAFAFDSLFIQPRRTFVVGDLWYSISLFGLLAVGLIVSILILMAKREARAAREREVQTAALFTFTKSLAEASTLDQILNAITSHIVDAFSPTVLVLPTEDGMTVRVQGAGWVLDKQELAAAARVLESGEESCANGSSPLKLRYKPLTSSQKTVGVLGLPMDTSHDRLSSHQEELLGTFMNLAALAITRINLSRRAHRVEVLQETDKLQKALLNCVSHNLRTPITSVIGALNSVLEDGRLLDAATQRHLLETAQDEAARLNQLVQNLLDMSRLEGGAVRVKTEPCDVHEIIGAALDQLGEMGRRRPISIAIAAGLPLVPMDQTLIVQVIANLADNALKYSPADSPIEIEARFNGDDLCVRVADRGNGIPEQDLDRVFEKFFRGASPGGSRGAGLGLSISKGFVSAHGGRIWAQRREQGGTEVIFLLPTEAKR